MPLNESTRKVRDRWPAEFDLEGVPRDTATRQRLLEDIHHSGKEVAMAQFRESSMAVQNPQNLFAVDKAQEPEPFIADINNPPQKRYKHQEYPKAMYHHTSGRTLLIHDEKEEKIAAKQGFQEEPSPKHDYSRIQFGRVAPAKQEAPAGERTMTAEELAALEAGDPQS